ncbi:PREDICTED: probable chitinase 2 [Ceratosolen solmsi marchali]|uniref:Probable chitinase 2 n=1 Tax=Ceratosolen solmsi marchali TaxID=326594 RepID=A0AAJ6YM70_9HYME|nr:PREDICTED: probable chitinase 2 [Ceratosolen solmsi marchali]
MSRTRSHQRTFLIPRTMTLLITGKALLLVLLSCGLCAALVNNGRKPSHGKYVACYFQSWAIFRNGDGVFQIQDIKPEYCTHLVYSFAGLNGTTFQIKSLDPWADLDDHNGKDGYRKLTQLRYQHPGLKVSLAIGGWNEGSYNYSEMARYPEHRKRFVNSVVHFLRAYNFQGLDLDWEFPTARGGADYDRHNYILLLQDLKRAFREHDFLLTAVISADTESMGRRYDIRMMSEYLDYIHVMTYDYHVLEGGVIMPNAPLDEVNKTLDYLVRSGAPIRKFILGLPTYGRSYILATALRSQEENPIGKPSLKNSWSGPYNTQEGFMGYNEICKYLLSNGSWIDKWDNLSSTPYAIMQHRVIVYDNAKSLQAKVRLAMRKGLGGVMIWSIDTDDFRGDCRPTHGRNHVDAQDYQYPLMQAIGFALERDSSGQPLALPALGLVLLCLILHPLSLPQLGLGH